MQGDDVYYLLIAENARVDPAHAMQFGFRLQGETVWAAGHTRPPGNAYLLAGDLCIIYNLRTTGTGTAAILVRVLFNAFAASQASEWTESAADMLFEGGGLVAGAAKAFAARAAEGGANYFLFRRLGAAMVRYLRPIWPPQR